jgi:hypothetical protein
VVKPVTDFALSPSESWLRGKDGRIISIVFVDGCFDVLLIAGVGEHGYSAGKGSGDSIASALAASMNDAMAKAHAAEESRDG